jgi:hypothetical protein
MDDTRWTSVPNRPELVNQCRPPRAIRPGTGQACHRQVVTRGQDAPPVGGLSAHRRSVSRAVPRHVLAVIRARASPCSTARLWGARRGGARLYPVAPFHAPTSFGRGRCRRPGHHGVFHVEQCRWRTRSDASARCPTTRGTADARRRRRSPTPVLERRSPDAACGPGRVGEPKRRSSRSVGACVEGSWGQGWRFCSDGGPALPFRSFRALFGGVWTLLSFPTPRVGPPTRRRLSRLRPLNTTCPRLLPPSVRRPPSG